MTLSLDGRVALVTGAGRGLGRAHALRLAAHGAAVVVCDIGVELDGTGFDPALAHAVVDEISRAGGKAVADSNDISTFEGAAAAVSAGVQRFGKVDIVVNNAGLAAGASIVDLTDDALARQFALHVHGSLGTSRAAWPMMAEQGWGRIVNTVSEEAFPSSLPVDNGGLGLLYGPAKAAVWSATLGLAAEGQGHGITANAISPGAFTRMNAQIFETKPTSLDLDPTHVSRVVAWLVSDAAADVTGKVVHVAGIHRREYIMRRLADTELVTRIDHDLEE